MKSTIKISSVLLCEKYLLFLNKLNEIRGIKNFFYIVVYFKNHNNSKIPEKNFPLTFTVSSLHINK